MLKQTLKNTEEQSHLLNNDLFRSKAQNINNTFSKKITEDPVIGLNKEVGINQGKLLYLGPNNGIYFINNKNNKSYILNAKKATVIHWF